MRAMALTRASSGHVDPLDLETPRPAFDQILVRVLTCGVCRTDLHVVDGDLPDPMIPVIPGHEIVGRVEQIGAGVTRICAWRSRGRSMVWERHAASVSVCRAGRENLCGRARYTGYQLHGGYAEYAASGRTLLLCTSRKVRRRTCGAALVCRSDWIPCVSDGRTRSASRHLRLRRGRPRHRAGGVFIRDAKCTPSSLLATMRAQDFARDDRRNVGGAFESTAPGDARRCVDLRARGQPGAGSTAHARQTGWRRRLRGHPYERYCVVSLSALVGRADAYNPSRT